MMLRNTWKVWSSLPRRIRAIKGGAVTKSEKEKERSILINDKLKLVVLYFLCAVLRGPEKPDQRIDYNLFKMIEDLDWCANYPWVKKTYQYLMTQVQKLDIIAKWKAAFEKLTRWNCHAFILPLMVCKFCFNYKILTFNLF